jgi:hypothetical protein
LCGMSVASRYFALARKFVAANRAASVVGLVVIVIAVIGALLIGLAIPLAIVLAGIVVAATFVTLEMYKRRRADRAVSDAASGVPEKGVATLVVLTTYALLTIVTLGLIQVVPYGRDHSNPPVTAEPDWSSPRTRELMVNSCFACHSNEVEWPWYSNIAPMSWAITDHVNEGRGKVNYSEFTTSAEDADKTVDEVVNGSMPPGYFTSFGLHSAANLDEAEVEELVAGLRATPGLSETE